MRAIFIRHAESSGQHQEAGLTGRGATQAQDLALALRSVPIGRLICSPYRRARQTAEPLADRAALQLDDRLAEWEIPWIPDRAWPHALRGILDGTTALPDGVEAREAAIARGVASFRDAASDGAVVSVLITHGKLLALVLAALCGGDPFDVFVTMRNAHAFEVAATTTTCEVRDLWHPAA